jgi:aminoglycoside phosphotransferase (APT) family kinase protein
VRDGLRSPLLERCGAWLEEHWPRDEGPTVFNWGDARIGNIMYDDFTPVAVFDWEMAALANREVELAYFIVMHRVFEDAAAEHGFPGMPHFLRADDVLTEYEQITGHTPRDFEFYAMWNFTRYGFISAQVSRRSVHFGEMEMPDDVDDLIRIRDALEHLLAGTYWASS